MWTASGAEVLPWRKGPTGKGRDDDKPSSERYRRLEAGAERDTGLELPSIFHDFVHKTLLCDLHHSLRRQALTRLVCWCLDLDLEPFRTAR